MSDPRSLWDRVVNFHWHVREDVYYHAVRWRLVRPSWLDKDFDDMTARERHGYFSFLHAAFRRVESRMKVTTVHGLSSSAGANWDAKL